MTYEIMVLTQRIRICERAEKQLAAKAEKEGVLLTVPEFWQKRHQLSKAQCELWWKWQDVVDAIANAKELLERFKERERR